MSVLRPNEKGQPEEQELHINCLHVGDIVNLKGGLVVPVDGLVFQTSELLINEAAMTGESDERRKEVLEVCQFRRQQRIQDGEKDKDAHALPSPLILSGTSIESGEGKMIVLMVGENSALGEIMKKLEKRSAKTPLQEKLEVIAEEIGKIGTYAALLTVHVLLLRYFIDGLTKRNIDLFGGESTEERPFAKNFKLWVDYVIIGVAVIVVAVPEGLPLAVMISLAYSQGRMLKDNNYVKKLAACEIMGGATNICSDKTGTLTLNQMKVAQVWLGKDISLDITQDENKKLKPVDPLKTFPTPLHWNLLQQSIACNVPFDYGATDKGLVELIETRCGANMDEIRVKHKVSKTDVFTRFPFSSRRKRMSTIICNATGKGGYDKRCLTKGAAEIILKGCTHYINERGERLEIDDRVKLEVDSMII